ncbi:MAG TPA: hypothetical protein VKV32_03470 [Stellaceae bacterium]|nr:hypothetical protein [Stellaceae bacterium]
MRVTAETVGDADSATRLAMLLIAEEYAAVAKRAYDEATGGPATGGDAPRGPAPQQPITTAKEA